MASIFGTYNPSILAIPAYYLLSVAPHTYAIGLATNHQYLTWDNRNPRSSSLRSNLQSSLDTETFAKYERAEACHANGMENLPLFASAVILGNLAGLKRESLNRFAAAYLVVRVAYTAAYLGTRTNGPTLVRSGLWIAGWVLCFRVIGKAARALGGKGLGM